ncbi:20S-pre-rRNA D-site endonuclease NOB1 [Verticillium alfalfae VaMs.102]|uniref:20S-pre-rRNA D-site endonuclease NOB1 n=1 Tax=Verticillium alfalfae (strain VaMs.102 / ATCC MYA-4576 / FGSC 10136) TaxID=526221 RepID=C9SNF3_VERA1|nr:20S-pre-rRNA D-site endonuclease NOB1 [Verticillium alfalfae VaMs.102]EEY20318.1 20S-pre-rRNA D-site endonuclease NOB1 [Verticillium alfalfae VaMs.102]
MSVDAQPSAADPQSTVLSEKPTTEQRKPIHSICLDTGPLIKNDPPVSTLIAQADELFTLPSIIDEIRDAATRTRVETTLLPFVKLRNPRPASVKFITNFARRTGDLEVMSRPDIQLLALTYELEMEQNNGDWRLRKDPNQKGISAKLRRQRQQQHRASLFSTKVSPAETVTELGPTAKEQPLAAHTEDYNEKAGTWVEIPAKADLTAGVSRKMEKLEVQDNIEAKLTPESAPAEDDGADSDDGWITPSNLKKHQAKDTNEVLPTTAAVSLKVAMLTSDYAMQNVALRIGLNLLSPAMSRITQVKNWVLRCHGCFQICKKMDRQFCPKCGQATLTRTSCTTADDGSFQIHLKRNFQWNNRGNVFSIPKAVAGTASGKLPSKSAGGKNNWGTKLLFAEDQKEYERAVEEKRRERKKDLMDEDYMPNIITGERTGSNGKLRLGPGRSVNSKRARS